ncbi:hypothetical protein ATANTOWER_030214 [Ataeniobius toweri]|uniref:Uncharacterized protein n=1 Tax=Ataeniobius toweri TaxID=208326 RepID=A0ABU7B3S7_9TELE|nr:hypothetical protein [Ataeniobius toweri]
MFPQEGSLAGHRNGFCVKLLNFTSQTGSQTGESSSEFHNKINPPTYANLTSVNKTTKNRKTRKRRGYLGMRTDNEENEIHSCFYSFRGMATERSRQRFSSLLAENYEAVVVQPNTGFVYERLTKWLG